MNEMDFSITKVNRVVQRIRTNSWHAEGLYFKQAYIMVIILEGEITYIIDDHKVFAKKNDVLIFAPGYVRSGYSNPQKPLSFVSVNFNMEYNDAAKEFFIPPFLLFAEIGESLHNKFADIAYAWEGKNPLYHIRCKNLASGILYDIVSMQLPHNKVLHLKKLESARTYIQANFKHDIQIEVLSKRLGLSPSYFRKLFKDAYGIAPMQYITNLRINTAKDLLLSGEVNVTEASHLSGFDDIYYFSTLFKKQTGVSPTEYVKANRK